MNKQFRYYELQAPQKWQAGYMGEPPDREEFFFDCSGCGAKAPLIKGFLGSAPDFLHIALLEEPGSPFPKLAVFCAACFDQRTRAVR